jgi:YfiH family protein
MSAACVLTHPLLCEIVVAHGFGTRAAPDPPGVVRPRQVHGAEVAWLRPGAPLSRHDADAVLSLDPTVPVAVVTADCVPILIADARGRAVAAVHAGWRGLAQGVIASAVAALARAAAPPEALRAVIGPCIGACCYEVDAPVLEPLAHRFGAALERAAKPARDGHALLDLAALVRDALVEAGVAAERIGGFEGACTRCDARRFHSYRRDGPAAGRLLHYIQARAGADTPPA